MFTFTCDPTCPHCGADLTKPDSINLDPATNETAQVDEHGTIAEEPGTQLVLDDPATNFACCGCWEQLDVTPVEEV